MRRNALQRLVPPQYCVLAPETLPDILLFRPSSARFAAAPETVRA